MALVTVINRNQSISYPLQYPGTIYAHHDFKIIVVLDMLLDPST